MTLSNCLVPSKQDLLAIFMNDLGNKTAEME